MSVKLAENIPVTVRAAVKRPADKLRLALQKVLAHLARSHTLSIGVDLPSELQTPVETALGGPARLTVREEATGQFSLRIAASGRRYRSFPSFWGVLQVEPSRGNSAIVTLRGSYTLPLANIARNVDKTFLRRAAHSSLRRFLENVIQETAREVPAASGAMQNA